jgi:hypothetical protein
MIVLVLASCVFQAVFAVAQDSESPQSQPVVAQDAATPPPEVAGYTEPQARYFGAPSVQWTTNVKESTMFRVTKPSPRLYSINNTMSGFSNVNQDEGDLNFHRGLVMDRSDFLTEMDVNFGKNIGVRASAAAWWDPIYNQRTNYLNSPNGHANDGAFYPSQNFCNALNGDCSHFAAGTKELEFLQAELLDAFVHARIRLGGMSLLLRGGQFAQQWGQTLFFGGNGIAGTMSPVDISKLLMVPNAEFKEIIRPVPQISANLQINPKLSIAAYYQLRFEGDRFPSVGSYFASGETMGAGAETLIFPNLVPASVVPNFGGVPGMAPPYPGAPFLVPQGAGYMVKLPDLDAKNWGQFGVAITWAGPHGYDIGLYAVQFHDKGPQAYLVPGMGATPYIPGVMGSDNRIIGSYKLVYPQNIQTLGMSVSKTVGMINYAAEVSGRRRQDLPIAAHMSSSFDKNNNPAYPLGDTVHANFSVMATVPRTSFAKEAAFLGEVAWNHLVSVTHAADWYPDAATGNAGNNSTANALAFMGVFTPTYRQVFPGTDLSVPVGFSYAPWGRSSALGIGFAGHQTGSANVGASLTYHQVNVFTATYQYFIGAQNGATLSNGQFSYAQTLGDRNYVAFSFYRTFGVKAGKI